MTHTAGLSIRITPHPMCRKRTLTFSIGGRERKRVEVTDLSLANGEWDTVFQLADSVIWDRPSP